MLRTAAAMRALGAEVERVAPGRWRVAGRGVGGLVEPADVLDMGNSGTARAADLRAAGGAPDLRGADGRRLAARAADAAGDGAAGRHGGALPGREPAGGCRWRWRAQRRRCRSTTRCPWPRPR